VPEGSPAPAPVTVPCRAKPDRVATIRAPAGRRQERSRRGSRTLFGKVPTGPDRHPLSPPAHRLLAETSRPLFRPPCRLKGHICSRSVIGTRELWSGCTQSARCPRWRGEG
jgi:hypothetical protein